MLSEGVGLLAEAGGLAVRTVQRDCARFVVRADALDPSPFVSSLNRFLTLLELFLKPLLLVSESTCEDAVLPPGLAAYGPPCGALLVPRSAVRSREASGDGPVRECNAPSIEEQYSETAATARQSIAAAPRPVKHRTPPGTWRPKKGRKAPGRLAALGAPP